jgi:hypothetical protein
MAVNLIEEIKMLRRKKRVKKNCFRVHFLCPKTLITLLMMMFRILNYNKVYLDSL